MWLAVTRDQRVNSATTSGPQTTSGRIKVGQSAASVCRQSSSSTYVHLVGVQRTGQNNDPPLHQPCPG